MDCALLQAGQGVEAETAAHTVQLAHHRGALSGCRGWQPLQATSGGRGKEGHGVEGARLGAQWPASGRTFPRGDQPASWVWLQHARPGTPPSTSDLPPLRHFRDEFLALPDVERGARTWDQTLKLALSSSYTAFLLLSSSSLFLSSFLPFHHFDLPVCLFFRAQC